MLLDNRGRVWSIGVSNSFGILGRGYEGQKYGETQIEHLEQLKELRKEFIVDVAISTNHCLALNQHGQVFSWGFGLDGALGYELSDLEACQIKPKLINAPMLFKKIFIGPQNSAFVTTDGTVFMCGQNQFQSCHPSSSLRTVSQLTHIHDLNSQFELCSEVHFTNISYTLIITQQGRVLELGFSPEHDQCSQQDVLALSNFTSVVHGSKQFLRKVSLLDNYIILQARAARICCALTVDNIIITWDCLKSRSFRVINLQEYNILSYCRLFDGGPQSVHLVYLQDLKYEISRVDLQPLVSNGSVKMKSVEFRPDHVRQVEGGPPQFLITDVLADDQGKMVVLTEEGNGGLQTLGNTMNFKSGLSVIDENEQAGEEEIASYLQGQLIDTITSRHTNKHLNLNSLRQTTI